MVVKKEKPESGKQNLFLYAGGALLLIMILIIFGTLALLLIERQIEEAEKRAVERCTMPIGFTCDQPSLPVLTSSGTLKMYLSQRLGKPITLYGILCTNDKTKTHSAGEAATGLPPGTVSKTEQINSQAVQAYTDLTCVDATGTPLMLQSGSEFNGKLYVWYRFSEDPDSGFERIAVGDIITKVQ